MQPSDSVRDRTAFATGRSAADSYRLLAESVQDCAVYMLDADGKITSWNTGAERIKGFTAAEALGQPFAAMYTREEAAEGLPERHLALALANGKFQDEGYRPRKNGPKFWASYGITTLYEDGRHVGYVALLRDLTEQKRYIDQLRESEERFRLLVEGARDYAIFMIDPDGRVASWNEGAARQYGYSADEILGRHRRVFYTPEDAAAGLPEEELRQAAATGRHTEEGWRIRKDGSRFWANGALTAVRDESGRLKGFVRVVRDLTERKRHIDHLKESEERFRLLLEGIQDYAVFMLDAEDRVTTWSQGAARLYGYSAEEIIGRHRRAFHTPEDVANGVPEAGIRRAVSSGRHFEAGWRVRKDGTRFWASGTLSALRDESGRLRGFVKVVQDLTDRKRSEEELARTTGILRAVIDGISDAVFVKDKNGRYLLLNETVARFLGRPVAEVLGKDDFDLFDPESARLVTSRDRRVMETNEAETEEEELTAVGITRTYLATKTPFRDPSGTVLGVLGISRDITDRKRVEVALRESEAKLAEAVRLARIGYWNRDLESGRLDWSDMLFEIFDTDPAGFDHSLEGFLSRVHPEDRSRVRGRILAAEAERTGFEHVYRIVAGERVRFIQENGSVVTNPQGDPIRVAGTARDVTELVQAEEAVRLRDRAIQAVTQGIVITDPNQRDNPIIYASPGFERLTGYGPDELVGRNCRFLQGKETDRGVVAQVRAAVRTGEPCDVELLNYRKDGKPFWNALSVSPVRDENGRLTHFIGVQTDVTDRHQLEMQFQQAQKMEAVGRLAGGVAHDFNNLLTIINGYTDLLVDQLPAGSPLREMVGEVHKAGERAGTLTRQLLVFSRQSVLEPKILDVNVVLADTEKMLRRLIGEDIQLSTILEPHLAPVKVDPGQLQQAIINLAVNSRDAMPRGGRLTVETRSVELNEKYCQSHPDCKPGRHMMLAVIDTGAGMDDATMARIFEPFFTTKEPGKGTGLGLAMVYGFVKSSGGHITVASELSRGTTFRLYFPQVREPVSLGGKSSPGLARLAKGHETVLLVEDDDAVRALTRRVLLGSGYAVLEAADGRDAVRVAEGHAGSIQLLVTDVVMPHMGGRQVAERIAAIKPGIKVLYCSGYTDDAVVRYGVESGIPFVQKPYSPAILTQKIREVLDG